MKFFLQDSLRLESSNHTKSSNFQVKLPTSSGKVDGIDEKKIIHFLKRNRDIDSLTVEHMTLNFLKQVNEILPALRNLTLISLSEDYSQNYSGGDIRMDVEELSIKLIDIFPKNIFFNRLNTLKLEIDGQLTGDWLEFLTYQINPDLKHIEIHTIEDSNQMLETNLTTVNAWKTKSVF